MSTETARSICNYLFKGNFFSIQGTPTGKFNNSYFVTTDKAEFVLRIAPEKSTKVLFYERDMMRREPGIHNLVLKYTSIPVARIIEYDFSASIVNRDWLLMERLPGRPLSETFLSKDKNQKLFFQLGRAVKELHAITNNWYGYPTGSNTGPEEKEWYSAFRKMWIRLLKDIESTGIYNAKTVTYLEHLLAEKKDAFIHEPTPSLLHMDIWSQNILVDPEGNLTGLIDWDRGLWGDPEIEFSVLEYCGTSPASFWKGYGTPPPSGTPYSIRRGFYFLYEHQKYIFIRSMRSNNIPMAQRYASDSLNIAREIEQIQF